MFVVYLCIDICIYMYVFLRFPFTARFNTGERRNATQTEGAHAVVRYINIYVCCILVYKYLCIYVCIYPFSVHTTFQYGGAPGKRHRLREAMIW